MAPRETENNDYAKFGGDKQKALWYVMVFSGVVNIVPIASASCQNFEYIESGLLARAKRTMDDANFTGNGFIQHHGGFDTSYQGRML